MAGFDTNTYVSRRGETARVRAVTNGHIKGRPEHWRIGDRFEARQALMDDCIEIRFAGGWVAIRGADFKTVKGSTRATSETLPERTDPEFVAHRELYRALDRAKKQLAGLRKARRNLTTI